MTTNQINLQNISLEELLHFIFRRNSQFAKKEKISRLNIGLEIKKLLLIFI